MVFLAWNPFTKHLLPPNVIDMVSGSLGLTVPIAGTGLAAFSGQRDGIIAFGRWTLVLNIATLDACNDAALLGYLKKKEERK